MPIPPEPRQPGDWETYKRKHGIKDGVPPAVNAIFGVVFMAILGGVLLTIPISLLTSLAAGRDAANSQGMGGAFTIAAIISGVFSLFFLMPTVPLEKKYNNDRTKQIRELYEYDWEEYRRIMKIREEEEARQRDVEVRARLAREQWERERPERERQEALRKAEEERERQRLAREADLRRRLREWQQAQSWARSAFEEAFQDVALHLAAEEGVTAPGDVLKVFAVAYPSFTVAADPRMGCLRELAGSDPRIAAVLAHLPKPDAQNTRPT